MSVEFVCPKCHAGLEETLGAYECPHCRDIWSLDRGVMRAPDFDFSQYWGEIPRFRFQHILHRAEILGPTRALERWVCDTRNSYLEGYALDRRRALCLELVDLPDHATLLDYGCGYGILGLAASKICRTVYLADSTFERIRFAKWRALEMGASNVVALAIQNWKMLPILPETLDLIVLNGVLEWIPTTVKGSAVDIQIEFLKAMRELLRPGGAIYIGIENRYALRYFGGYPDDHTGLRFTSIMPRKLAEVYCQVRRRGSYRTVTWSLAEYKRNLTDLGFSDVDIFYIYPDYRFPEAACRISDHFALNRLHIEQADGRGLGGTLKRLIKSSVGCLKLWPSFVYSYGIVARKAASGAETHNEN
jgi:SAM-dependent methyltransferase